MEAMQRKKIFLIGGIVVFTLAAIFTLDSLYLVWRALFAVAAVVAFLELRRTWS